MSDYKQIAQEARLKVLDLIYKAQTSHIGSNFSCIDIMAVLFEQIDLDKDKFILSKGWAAASLYYFLWRKGRITKKELDSYCQKGSKFIGLAEPIHKDIPFAGGSMGYGFPAAVGYALAKKLKGEPGKVYCLMSDGELAIGTSWESFLIARHHNLNNLVILVDWNGLQAMGKTKDIINLGGFLEPNIDGHDFKAINRFILHEHNESIKIGIFFTTKGKGVSFMENNNLYHYKQLTKKECLDAKKELRQS